MKATHRLLTLYFAMHSVPVMISTVTQAHTVSESVTMERTSLVSRVGRILCMQVMIC